jgi:DNA-binding winged helix-turn-helix (wHTH) protein/tetratricopeptide (TPR) repeat protein
MASAPEGELASNIIQAGGRSHGKYLGLRLVLYYSRLMAESQRISFDGWTLHAASGELARAGITRRLSQQPLRVLLELVEHPGQVVTRERLVRLLWPKGIVDFDNSLNGIVRKLRVTLGDDSETPRYIETLPRIGYRFVAALDPPASPLAGEARRPSARGWRRWSLPGAGALAVLAAAWWLARPAATIPEVPVDSSATLVPRRTTSARAYEHYLDGLYQRSRRDLNGAPLALAAFDAALREDPRYAEAWAALSSTLIGTAITQEGPVLPTLERAGEAARRAVLIDGSLPDAHAAQGLVHTFLERDYAAAERDFARALQLDDKLARAWHGVAVLRAFQGRADEALAAMRRARELEPMTPHFNSQYGLLLYHARRFDEAIAHVRPIVESQPKFDQARSVLIRSLVAKGELSEALAQAGLRTSDGPNFSDLGLVLAASGQRAEAEAEVARLERLGRQGKVVAYEVAALQAALGNVAPTCAALDRAAAERAPFIGWTRLDPRLDAVRAAPCFAKAMERIYTTMPTAGE